MNLANLYNSHEVLFRCDISVGFCCYESIRLTFVAFSRNEGKLNAL